MPLPQQRLQALIESKEDAAAAALSWPVPGEGWAIIDNCLVIYDFEAPPQWLSPALAARDEDGNTRLNV